MICAERIHSCARLTKKGLAGRRSSYLVRHFFQGDNTALHITKNQTSNQMKLIFSSMNRSIAWFPSAAVLVHSSALPVAKKIQSEAFWKHSLYYTGSKEDDASVALKEHGATLRSHRKVCPGGHSDASWSKVGEAKAKGTGLKALLESQLGDHEQCRKHNRVISIISSFFNCSSSVANCFWLFLKHSERQWTMSKWHGLVTNCAVAYCTGVGLEKRQVKYPPATCPGIGHVLNGWNVGRRCFGLASDVL